MWAWERPEDLRFLPAGVEVAVQTGFVELSGEAVLDRGRRFPLRVGVAAVTTALVHVQVDRRRPLAWTPAQRAAAATAVLRHARTGRLARVQVDFEVRASERRVLLDLLRDVRAGLPAGTTLSMTALASWCGEGWLAQAPVDEVAPMLFRMGRTGAAIRGRLAQGGDLGDPRCRDAVAVSVDAPVLRAPAVRRVYLWSPRSWTAADFETVRERTAAWGG